MGLGANGLRLNGTTLNWLESGLACFSNRSILAQAIRYAFAKPKRLQVYLDRGVLGINQNTADRSDLANALGYRNWLFAASGRYIRLAAFAQILIESSKQSDADSKIWLLEVVDNIADQNINRVDELLPWCYAVRMASLDAYGFGSVLRVPLLSGIWAPRKMS
jgi:transposase